MDLMGGKALELRFEWRTHLPKRVTLAANTMGGGKGAHDDPSCPHLMRDLV